jgi:adhesin/invasin
MTTRLAAIQRLFLGRVLPLVFAAGCRDDVTGPGGKAGPVAAGQSQVTASLATVSSGATVALTLHAMDAQGRAVGRGGSTVVFNTSGGTSTGTIGTTTDHGNGTYEATFTGVMAGSATTIGATIDGAPVTTPLPVIQVKPGTFSPMTSILTISPRTVLPGGKATLEFIARDAAGNQLETGGLDVSFDVSGGSSVGVIGEVTDHGNGRYTAPFTAAQVGTPITVSAEVDGAPVASSPPTVTVTRGISLEHSVFSIPYDTLTVKSGLRLTLQLRDSSDIARTSGGDTVQFSVTSGDDGGEGTLNDYADHDDGTYTANFTGTKAGTVLLGVRINGRNKGDALLAVTIQSSPLTPQNSTVRVSAETLAAGDTATLSAEVRDLNGDPLTGGELTVTFTIDIEGESVDGMSSGEIGPTRYDGDGVYSATFTAQRAGTPVTVGAKVDDTAIQMLDSSGVSHLPTITVTPGSVSPDSTLLETAPKRIPRGDSAAIRLTARDAYGNRLAEGGLSVVIQRTGGQGVSVGRIGPVTDHEDGTYTAHYFGDSTGTPDLIGAKVDAITITSPQPTITVGSDCTAGPVSFSVSDLTINDNTKAQFPVKVVTLPSGVTTTVTLRVSDDRACPVEQPHTVVVTAAGGTSTGVFGDMVNLGDGRYTVTFIGHTAGTATTLSATIDGAPVTSQPVTVTVVPGDISTKTSLVTASKTSVAVGDSVELTLEGFDAAGNRIRTGGRAVVFVVENSNVGGVIGPTRDARNGTYTATYVAVKRGIIDTIAARIDATPVLRRVTVSVSP